MNRGNIFHRSFGNQCYALDENRLKISLTTGDDIEKVYIVTVIHLMPVLWVVKKYGKVLRKKLKPI